MIVAFPLPSPPATLLLVVDPFRICDAESLECARASLRTRGYETILILGQAESVRLVHELESREIIEGQCVPCPAMAPHADCVLCRGSGVVEAA